MNLRVGAPLLLGLAMLLASGCASGSLRVDLRRRASPWTPPATTTACLTETVIPFLWIEPPPAHASWVFHLVMGPKDSIARRLESIPGPESEIPCCHRGSSWTRSSTTIHAWAHPRFQRD